MSILKKKKRKKKQVDENGCKYILSRIDVYFTEYLLAVEVDEKGHTDRDLIFEKKIQEALEKNLDVNLLELIRIRKAIMQTVKQVDYKHLLVTFKTELKKLQKESNKNIKELEDKIKNQNLNWQVKLPKKIKVFKINCQKHFVKLLKMKNTQSKRKPIKIG